MDEKGISVLEEFIDLNAERNLDKFMEYEKLFTETATYQTTRGKVEKNLKQIEVHLPQDLRKLLHDSFTEMHCLAIDAGSFYFRLGFIKSMHFMIGILREGREIKLEVKGL